MDNSYREYKKEIHIILNSKGYGKAYYELKKGQIKLSKEGFIMFKEQYLEKFRKYYREKDSNRKELKNSVFNNPKLTERQKINFWKKVVE